MYIIGMHRVMVRLDQHKFAGMTLWNFVILQVFFLWGVPVLVVLASGLGAFTGSGTDQMKVLEPWLGSYLDGFLFREIGNVAVGLVIFPLVCLLASMLVCYKKYWSVFENKLWFIVAYFGSWLILFVGQAFGMIGALPIVLSISLLDAVGLGDAGVAIFIATIHLAGYLIMVGMFVFFLLKPSRQPASNLIENPADLQKNNSVPPEESQEVQS